MAAINTNVQSLNAQRSLASTASSLSTSMQRLSSGMRVNASKDDAAGLAIAERMQAQTKGMNAAIRNANDAISMAQTAEGSLGSISNNLQRMRELAVQSATGTNQASDRTALNEEYQLLASENSRIADNTKFNGNSVIAATTFSFQVGANTSADNSISIAANAYAFTPGDLTSAATAATAITALDTEIDETTSARSEWGATQNRLEAVVLNLRTGAENSAAARGRIMDTDYASETASLSRAQVLQQAGTAMVAQANQGPQGVLALLR